MKFKDPTLITTEGKELAASIPEPPVRGKIPAWLSEMIRHESKRQREERWHGWVVDEFQDIAGSLGGWLDHWGTAKRHGRDVLVSEPYGLGKDAVAAMMQFCERFGLDLEIKAASFHFPTYCLRIEVYPESRGDAQKGYTDHGSNTREQG